MMAEKARLFKDDTMRKIILNTTNPAKLKALGRKVRNYDEDIWHQNRMDIVLDGNMAKFCQNEDMKAQLLATGEKELVEASPFDTIWGIGLSATNPKALNKATWRGQNLLGNVLMTVRERLRHSSPEALLIWSE